MPLLTSSHSDASVSVVPLLMEPLWNRFWSLEEISGSMKDNKNRVLKFSCYFQPNIHHYYMKMNENKCPSRRSGGTNQMWDKSLPFFFLYNRPDDQNPSFLFTPGCSSHRLMLVSVPPALSLPCTPSNLYFPSFLYTRGINKLLPPTTTHLFSFSVACWIVGQGRCLGFLLLWLLLFLTEKSQVVIIVVANHRNNYLC